VTFAPLSNPGTVAEHTLGLIIALAKNMIRCDRELRNGNFNIRNQLLGTDLEGKTLGIVGMGRIGSMVAQKSMLGFSMKVIGYDPFLTKDQLLSGIDFTNDWEYIFKNSDFLSLHLPSTEKTRKIVGKNEFEMMKSSAFLINASRGEIVDEKALIRALEQSKIAGAGLDVFDEEPPEKNNPLFEMQNVVLTPHNAALTAEATARMSLHAAIGIDEVLSGKKPGWPVNNPVTLRDDWAT
jgi:D-3-phosphoglycerate dehydrogenase